MLQRLYVAPQGLELARVHHSAAQLPQLHSRAAEGQHESGAAQQSLTTDAAAAAVPRAAEARGLVEALLEVRARDAQVLTGEVQERARLVHARLRLRAARLRKRKER